MTQQLSAFGPAVTKGASISSCGIYRYSLRRDWDIENGRVCWIMLNPSTADANEDDPTIRRCIGFAKKWGLGGIVVVNLFAFRATYPAQMLHADDPIGPDNDAAITEAVSQSRNGAVVCGWGTNAPLDREAEVLALIRRLGVVPRALRLTKAGAPAHPLYLPGHLVPEPFADPKPS